jgi:hypothetical protein
MTAGTLDFIYPLPQAVYASAETLTQTRTQTSSEDGEEHRHCERA